MAAEKLTRRCGSRTGRARVQTLVFDRALWTPATAQAWALEHGYAAGKVETLPNTLRIRQRLDSKASCQYRMQPFGRGTGIQALLEFGKAKATGGKAKRPSIAGALRSYAVYRPARGGVAWKHLGNLRAKDHGHAVSAAQEKWHGTLRVTLGAAG